MKYEFTGERKILPNGTQVHRIRALRDIPGAARAGELGGWLESAENLSQGGTCWVPRNSVAYGQAQVSGDTQVSDMTTVSGAARRFFN